MHGTTAGLLVAAAIAAVTALVPGWGRATYQEVRGMDRQNEAPVAAAVLEDFAADRDRPARSWRVFTDRVMGGVSEAGHEVQTIEGVTALRLQGSVRLDNNGGFVQSAFRPEGALPGRDYDGLRLRVRGNGESGYYVFLRTSTTWFPWSHYAAPIPATATWTDVEVPWDAFERNAVPFALDPGKIRQIGIVAYGREMEADIAVARMELYRQSAGEAVPTER